MIAGSFGVSAALEQSGGAAAIANLIVEIGKNAGGGNFTIAAVYIATTLISQIIANNSAAALMFPIAATISTNDGVDVSLCWRCPLARRPAPSPSSLRQPSPNLLALCFTVATPHPTPHPRRSTCCPTPSCWAPPQSS